MSDDYLLEMSYEYICVPEDALPLGRASPTSDYFTDSAYSTLDIDPGNPRAALAQRLQHLAIVVQSRGLGDATATSLHGRLDEMERLLAGDSIVVELDEAEDIQPVNRQEGNAQAQAQAQEQEHDTAQEREDSTEEEDDDETVEGDTTRVTALDAPSTPTTPGATDVQKNPREIPGKVGEPDEAERKAGELAAAHEVLARVSYMVKELHLRYEELKHVHDIAIARSDDEAKRSAQLASKVEMMENDLSDDCAELTYLKVQLKGLEVLAYPYVHMTEDETLLQGIERWKLDWKAVDQRFEARRQKWQVSPRHGEIDQESITS